MLDMADDVTSSDDLVLTCSDHFTGSCSFQKVEILSRGEKLDHHGIVKTY